MDFLASIESVQLKWPPTVTLQYLRESEQSSFVSDKEKNELTIVLPVEMHSSRDARFLACACEFEAEKRGGGLSRRYRKSEPIRLPNITRTLKGDFDVNILWSQWFSLLMIPCNALMTGFNWCIMLWQFTLTAKLKKQSEQLIIRGSQILYSASNKS
jgi:hypothetical protein